MEVDKACQNCQLGFNMEDRKPKILPCAHIVCMICIIDSLEKNKCIKCGLCRQEHYHIAISDLQDEERILKKLTGDFISCSHHKRVAASYVDSKTLESLCDECYYGKSQKNMVYLEETHFPEIFKNRWRDLSLELNNLPYVLKKKYWNYAYESNEKKLELCFKIAAFRSNEIFCDADPFVSAKWITRDSLEPLCENCSQKYEDEEIMPIEANETLEYVYETLCGKIRISDLACIPSIYYKPIKEFGWKLKDMLDLYRFLKESEWKAKITEKTKCPICLSNFGFGWDTPMKLSCSQANHAVCLKCFSNPETNFRCPLDDNEYEISNPIPLEVDDLFSYPWCRNCNQIMGKNKMPVKSKCIHPICNECDWCPICKDNVIVDQQVLDKNLSKKIEFMETYCLEHKEPAIKFKKILWEVPLLNIEIKAFPKVTCKDCKGGTFILKNKDHFKIFDTSIQDIFCNLTENLSKIDSRYKGYTDQLVNNFTVLNYNQRLEKIEEMAKILEDLAQSMLKKTKKEIIIPRFGATYPYDGELTKGLNICENQVESITLEPSLEIILAGLILDRDVRGVLVSADIYLTCSDQIIVDSQQYIGSFHINNKQEEIRFETGIPLAALTKYTLTVIYKNYVRTFYNKNPSRRFLNLECSAAEIKIESPKNDKYKCYRNDVGGQIIGFIISD